MNTLLLVIVVNDENSILAKESCVKLQTVVIVFLILNLSLASYSQGYWGCGEKHDVGKINLSRSVIPTMEGGLISCHTGFDLPDGNCLFPKGYFVEYLGDAIAWIGGVVGGDTLVSSKVYVPILEFNLGNDPYEYHPHEYPYGNIIHRSTLDPASPEFKGAISEQDFISVSTDTIPEGARIHPDYFHFRPHIPMGLEIEHKSYAWSLGYAEDFVMFDWLIRNIGDKYIHDAYVAIDMSVAVSYFGRAAFSGDLCGFLSEVPSVSGCDFKDNVIMMWSADNDGDPVLGQFVNRPTADPASGDFVVSCRHVSAIQLIDAPVDLVPYSRVSYNWWVYDPRNDLDPQNDIDFGPRHRENYRDFRTGGGLGVPWGDVNQYYTMRNGEIDYDPAYTKNIDIHNQTWMYPPQSISSDIATGARLTQLLSVGPFDIPPGGEVPIVFSFVMGENFHKDPHNLGNLPDDPDEYYANLDFSDLITNAQWARFIYDNPGVDTDGDGYFGEFRVCVLDSVLDVDSTWIATVAETTYYKGDGVPDWKAALPPPAPKMWVTPTFRGIHIRFNGSESETSKDIFTRMNDFEGYQVYLSRDDREQSYSLIASYDIENYDKYIWNEEKQPDAGWELLDFPATLQEIRCKYAYNCNDSSFDPLRFRPSQPYQLLNYPESLFYWVKHQWNVSEFGVTSDIKKRYPLARDPTKVSADSLTTDDYTDDGYLKYFDYEFTIEDILPTVPYYVSVTAFDFGWPKSNLEPLETSITENAQQVFASIIDSAFGGDYDKVVVYPNPYRNDENYRQRGFEGLGDELRSNERVRRIHFANLPPKCIIKILSLDGDLVREIHHDKDPSDPTASHEEWGLISRNGLAVVSGLYDWVVESDDGTVQLGKLAIIL